VLNKRGGKGEGGEEAVEAIDGSAMMDANELSLTIVALSCSILISDDVAEKMEILIVSRDTVSFGRTERVSSG